MLKKIILALVVIAAVGFAGWRVLGQDESPKDEPQNTETKQQAKAGFDKTKYSTDEPGSMWWVVNKKRPLPDGYVPADLTVPDVTLRLAASAEQMQFSKTAEPALKQMFAAAAADGVTLVFGSGYRSQALQKQFYDSYVAQDGQEAADRYSARPGTSEHQTGLTFDVTSPGGDPCDLEICFKDTPGGKWVAENAHKYGFIIRYPDGKESITTYQYEPWHLRYVGLELAAELERKSQTMEEFFRL